MKHFLLNRLTRLLTLSALGMMFAGLSALSYFTGINKNGILGIGIGLIFSGLLLSLSVYVLIQILNNKNDINS